MIVALRPPTQIATRVGRLSEAPEVLAERIHDQLVNGDRTVFAAADGGVYVEQPERMDGIPFHWIAGTFTVGHSYRALVEDIAFFREDRIKD
ncbi:MAG TPA: hypothetical protein VFS55_09620 [Dokdonella sp.]|nr:hypothetical protein [Dokdonella sp.]